MTGNGNLLTGLGVSLPLIQAPMAGISTAALAAAVSDAGGLGSIALGATDPHGARLMLAELHERTTRPVNVNLFVHSEPSVDVTLDAEWLGWLRPSFAEFGVDPPSTLRTIYRSFVDHPEMLALLLEQPPQIVSFHFGLPPAGILSAFRDRGVALIATATNLDEARAIEDAGLDAIVAQGFEAGGHRGMFDPSAADDALGTIALTRLLASRGRLPVIAAGGIMDGVGIAAALDLGAIAAQLGTAFIACPESSADEPYRAALVGPGAYHTTMTSLISGRPARAVGNRFTGLAAAGHESRPPDYPIAYDAGKALHAAASARGEHGFAAHWAGQGAPLARALPAADLVAALMAELNRSRRS